MGMLRRDRTLLGKIRYLMTDRNKTQAALPTRHRACQTSVIPAVNHHCSNLSYSLWYSTVSLPPWKRDDNIRAILLDKNYTFRFRSSFLYKRKAASTQLLSELFLSEKTKQ